MTLSASGVIVTDVTARLVKLVGSVSGPAVSLKESVNVVPGPPLPAPMTTSVTGAAPAGAAVNGMSNAAMSDIATAAARARARAVRVRTGVKTDFAMGTVLGRDASSRPGPFGPSSPQGRSRGRTASRAPREVVLHRVE